MNRSLKTTIRNTILICFIFFSLLPIAVFVKIPHVVGSNAIILLSYYKFFTSIFGFIGALLMFWQYVLGFRVIASAFTEDIGFTNKIHQLLGKWGFFLILAHPVFAMLTYGEVWISLIFPSFTSMNVIYTYLGNIALYMIIFIWLTSELFRKRLSYRVWYYLHLISYIILPFVFLHSLMIGIYLNSTNLSYYWLLLIAIYLFLVLYRVIFQSGITKAKYRVVDNSVTAQNIASIILEPINTWIIPFPGQYFHIQLHPWGEAHPFSVAAFDKKTGKITFASKLAGSFTKSLNSVTPGKTVYIDGSYGIFTSKAYEDAAPAVFIAGGIGVTPFLEALRDRAAESFLFYSCKNRKDIAYETELDTLEKERQMVHIYKSITEENPLPEGYIQGRITAELFQKTLGDKLQKSDFYICGPSAFMDAMKSILLGLNVKDDRIFIEEFSF